MQDVRDWYIIKEKVFWGLKSIDPPEPFLNFLMKNTKDLKNLLDDNRLSVIDAEGNEIDDRYWENIILSFYTDKRAENEKNDKRKSKKELKKKIKIKNKLEKTERKKTNLLLGLISEQRVQDEKNRDVLEQKIRALELELAKIKGKIEYIAYEIKTLNKQINS